MRAGAGPTRTPEDEPEVRTFGMPDPGDAEDEIDYDPND
jgi:hypothetical protein